jgi:hypothetical protein
MGNDGRTRRTTPIVVLVHEGAAGAVGLKIPEFAIELHGEDLAALVELAEEHLWWHLEASGNPVPEAATLAVTRVTKEEFGPSCYELEAEEW